MKIKVRQELYDIEIDISAKFAEGSDKETRDLNADKLVLGTIMCAFSLAQDAHLDSYDPWFEEYNEYYRKFQEAYFSID